MADQQETGPKVIAAVIIQMSDQGDCRWMRGGEYGEFPVDKIVCTLELLKQEVLLEQRMKMMSEAMKEKRVVMPNGPLPPFPGG